MVVAAGGAAAAVLARHHPTAEQVDAAVGKAGGLGRFATDAMAGMVNRITHSLASSLRSTQDEKDASGKPSVGMPANNTEDTAGLP
jgi:hypothetical protein